MINTECIFENGINQTIAKLMRKLEEIYAILGKDYVYELNHCAENDRGNPWIIANKALQ